MVPGRGFEPRLKDSESFVLPLDDPGASERNTKVEDFTYFRASDGTGDQPAPGAFECSNCARILPSQGRIVNLLL